MKTLSGIVFFFLCIGIGLCHPPDSLKMSFDSTGTVLSVRVFHTVKTPANHYILSVTVDVNGKELVKQTYYSQFNKNEQVAVYKVIDAKKDDKINVTAQCNITGKKKETIIYNFAK